MLLLLTKVADDCSEKRCCIINRVTIARFCYITVTIPQKIDLTTFSSDNGTYNRIFNWGRKRVFFFKFFPKLVYCAAESDNGHKSICQKID